MIALYNITIFERKYLPNHNSYLCKIVMYSIGVTLCINATISVLFSFERALAINYPLQVRNFKQNYGLACKIIALFLIILSFIAPSYNLFLLDIVNKGNKKHVCDVPSENDRLYFNMTIIFVLAILGLPFLIISLSNVSILMRISKRSNSLVLFQGGYKSETSNNELRRRVSKGSDIFNYYYTYNTSYPIEKETKNSRFSFFKCRAKLENPCLKNLSIFKLDKHIKITKMFISISASFVLLNLPYFISWCIYANFRIQNQHRYEDTKVKEEIKSLYKYVKLSEILNLLNYSLAGLLYFATGKFYRQHLFKIFTCSHKKYYSN